MHSTPLKEIKIGEESRVLFGLLFSFIGLFFVVLLFSLPTYNLWVKLCLNAVIIILFFIFLVKKLNSHEDEKSYLIILNQEGFYYRMKLVCKWNEFANVRTEKKFKISNGIGSEDHYLIVVLKSRKRLYFKISILDADIYDLRDNILKFYQYYGAETES